MSDYILNLRAKVGHDLLLMPSVSIVLFDEQGRILMVRHSEGDVWVMPGGSVEPPELLADAAVREMREETGLWVEPVGLLGVYGGSDFLVTYTNGDRVEYLMFVFECRVVGGTLRPDGVEIKETAYISKADLAELNRSPWVDIVLPDLFKRSPQPLFQPSTWQPPADGIRKGGMPEYVRRLRQKVGTDLLISLAAWAVVRDDQGRILLQRRADNGTWAGPAGGIDPHESPSDAIVRETWEETGVIVEPVRIIHVLGGEEYYTRFSNGDLMINYGAIFECRVVDGQPSADGMESTEVAFFAPHELPLAQMRPRWQKLFAAVAGDLEIPQFVVETR